MSVEVFEHFTRLPLGWEFSLDHTILDFEDPWTRVVGTWQSLTTIRCIEQPTYLDDLLLLSSKLPKLESIECNFDLTHAARTIKRNWQPVGQLSFYPSLKNLTIKQYNLRKLVLQQEYHLDNLARAIAYFWPKLEIQSVQADLLYDNSDKDEMDKEALFAMFQNLIRAHTCFFHSD